MKTQALHKVRIPPKRRRGVKPDSYQGENPRKNKGVS